MSDKDEALRLLREAFPESEGWIAYCEPFISSSRATVLTPCIRISYERKTCVDAARAVIAARDQLVADAVAQEREHADALAQSLRVVLHEEVTQRENELGEDYVQCDRCDSSGWGSRDVGADDEIEHSEDCIFAVLTAHDALRGPARD